MINHIEDMHGMVAGSPLPGPTGSVRPVCPMCLGTGTVGDHGPGRRGNDEVQTCDCLETPKSSTLNNH